MDTVLLLLLVLVAAALYGGLAVGVGWLLRQSRRREESLSRHYDRLLENYQHDRTRVALRVSDLEHKLLSHTWGDYAQLQNGVITSEQQAVVLHQFPAHPSAVSGDDNVTPLEQFSRIVEGSTSAEREFATSLKNHVFDDDELPEDDWSVTPTAG